MDVSTIRLEHKIAAVLACLRGEATYETAAERLGVTAADVQTWEHTVLSAGERALQAEAAEAADAALADSPPIDGAPLLDPARQTNLRSESILQASIDGIVAWDESWQVVMANQAACRLLGMSLEELLGKRLDDADTSALLTQIARAGEEERI